MGPIREGQGQPAVVYNRGAGGHWPNPGLLGIQGSWMGNPGAYGGWGEARATEAAAKQHIWVGSDAAPLWFRVISIRGTDGATWGVWGHNERLCQGPILGGGTEVVLPLVQEGARNPSQGWRSGARVNGEMWSGREGYYQESHRLQNVVSGRSQRTWQHRCG